MKDREAKSPKCKMVDLLQRDILAFGTYYVP